MTIFRTLFPPRPTMASYSQCGEDSIIRAVFGGLARNLDFYVDIGAYHPTKLSNTYAFYREGAHGLCIEANPTLCSGFKKVRPRDIVLNRALAPSGSAETISFFLIDPNTLSTTDREEARRIAELPNHRIRQELRIASISPREVLQLAPRPIDLLSIDIEMDVGPILDEFIASEQPPTVICVETLEYAPALVSARKNRDLIQRVEAGGYMVYGDTYVNTIFLRR